MRSLKIALIPLLAGLVFAQDQIRTETKTTKTTWSGTLVDAACQSSHTERKETVRENTADRSTRTETTRTETVDCPVTTTTSSFGLLTSDGRFIRFDNPSNTRVVEIVRTNKNWSKNLADKTPVKVSVIGMANGDVAVVESLNPDVTTTTTTTTVGSAERIDERADIMFDVRWGGDRGKLVVTSKGVTFEDVSDAKHSHMWSYSQIKEFRREGGNELKIAPYSGESMEFHLDGPAMTDTVYRTISDRIVAARGR